MNRSLKLRLLLCAVVSIVSIWLLSPTLFTLLNPDKKDQLPGYLPNTSMNLGLDLQGGVHLVVGTDLDKVVTDQLQTFGNNVKQTLKESNITDVSFEVDKKRKELLFNSTNSSSIATLIKLVKSNFGQAIEYIGKYNDKEVYRLIKSYEDHATNRAREQTIETLRNRIDEFGVAEPIISKLGADQIVVQFPGATEAERLKSIISRTAKLDFKIVHECKANINDGCMERQRAETAAKIVEAETAGNYNYESIGRLSTYTEKINQDLKGKLPENTEVAFSKNPHPTIVDKEILIPYLLSTEKRIGGDYIDDARVSLGQDGDFGPQVYSVAFNMNPAGAKLLGDLTSTNINSFMAIILDGVVKSAPYIKTTIKDSGSISVGSGADPQKEANDLAIVLRAGALPTSIEIQEERVIGPSIGRDAIEAGKKALAVAMICIFIFMILYYGWAGVLADFATLINAGIIFAILGSIGATLTLPGIAGIVLTIGMAVDALIIIFERMREEIRDGKNNNQVIEVGFNRAFTAILDSNVTTAIGAFVLLQFGTGSIKGFALTLLVGIITNVFIATFFSRTLFKVFASNKSKPLTLGLGRKEVKNLKIAKANS